MTWVEIALIAVSCVLVVVVLAWIVTALKRKKSSEHLRVDDVYIKDGTRLTKSKEAIDENGDVVITLNKEDIVLERGKVYVVSKEGKILPGKYTVLSADQGTDCFNIRLGGLVKEYKHFSSVVLAEGDEISCVSANIILR